MRLTTTTLPTITTWSTLLTCITAPTPPLMTPILVINTAKPLSSLLYQYLAACSTKLTLNIPLLSPRTRLVMKDDGTIFVISPMVASLQVFVLVIISTLATGQKVCPRKWKSIMTWPMVWTSGSCECVSVSTRESVVVCGVSGMRVEYNRYGGNWNVLLGTAGVFWLVVWSFVFLGLWMIGLSSFFLLIPCFESILNISAMLWLWSCLEDPASDLTLAPPCSWWWTVTCIFSSWNTFLRSVLTSGQLRPSNPQPIIGMLIWATPLDKAWLFMASKDFLIDS